MKMTSQTTQQLTQLFRSSMGIMRMLGFSVRADAAPERTATRRRINVAEAIMAGRSSWVGRMRNEDVAGKSQAAQDVQKDRKAKDTTTGPRK